MQFFPICVYSTPDFKNRIFSAASAYSPKQYEQWLLRRRLFEGVWATRHAKIQRVSSQSGSLTWPYFIRRPEQDLPKPLLPMPLLLLGSRAANHRGRWPRLQGQANWLRDVSWPGVYCLTLTRDVLGRWRKRAAGPLNQSQTLFIPLLTRFPHFLSKQRN